MFFALLLALVLAGSSVSAQEFIIGGAATTVSTISPTPVPITVATTVFTHSDVTDLEATMGPVTYGTVNVELLRPGCEVAFTGPQLALLGGESFPTFHVTEDNNSDSDNLVSTTVTVNVETLDAIGDDLGTDVKDTASSDGTTFTFLKYCARLSLESNAGVQSSRNVDVTLAYTTNVAASTVTTAETTGGTQEDNVDLGAFSVSASAAPSPLVQGQQLAFTLTAVSPPTPAPPGLAAVIESIAQWECSDASGNQQIIVNNGNPETSATVLPACGGTPTGQECMITTFLDPVFFTGAIDSVVTCEGTVALLLASGRRARALLSGNIVEKSTSTVLTALSVNADDDDDDDDWSFLGWIFSCFGLF